MRLDLGLGATGVERLKAAGMGLDNMSAETPMVTNVRLGSQPAKYGIRPGDSIIAVAVPADRPPRQLFFLPAFALLGLIVWLQRHRRRAVSLAALAD